MASKKHEAIIRAWLDGAKIEYFMSHAHGKGWRDCEEPGWHEDIQYRIKPAEPEREYFETDLPSMDLYENYRGGNTEMKAALALVQTVNYALRVAQDKGQIVTRAEFDRAVGDRQKRDMAVARAVDAWYCEMIPNKQRNSDNYLSEIIRSVK